MDQRGPVPSLRPPNFSGGGGQTPPFGASGAPGMPQPGTRKARDLAESYALDVRGRFVERPYRFPNFGAIANGTTAPPQAIQFTNLRSTFSRIVAMRGGLSNAATVPLTGLELGGLAVRLQLNGSEDFGTTGQGAIAIEYDALFSPIAPWFFFAAPPRVRNGDTAQATITNNFSAAAGPLTPYLVLRVVDDEWWRALYGT